MENLKETVDIVVNSRYPEMNREGRELLAQVLIRKELEKGEMLLNEGQISRHMVFVGKGMLRQFYYKNGKDVTEHFSYEGCILMCIESLLKQEPTRLMAEALEPAGGYISPLFPSRICPARWRPSRPPRGSPPQGGFSTRRPASPPREASSARTTVDRLLKT